MTQNLSPSKDTSKLDNSKPQPTHCLPELRGEYQVSMVCESEEQALYRQQAEARAIELIQETRLQIDPVLRQLNFQFRNVQIAIGYRMIRFYAPNDPELVELIAEGRRLESEIKMYKINHGTPTPPVC